HRIDVHRPVRRLRLHEGVSGREAVPGCEDRYDLRGHQQHAAPDDCEADDAVTDTLTPRQRAVLRALAQTIKPILQIGREGLTDAVSRSVLEALNTRELLKVRVLETAKLTPAELGDALASATGAQLVQVIGRTIVLYRRHPEKPEIQLPSV